MESKPTGGKTPFNCRLSPGGKGLLVQLGEHMGLTRSGVIETAIRVLAQQQKIPGGYFTRDELESKWDAFMEEDEATRSAELEKKRLEATENTLKTE